MKTDLGIKLIAVMNAHHFALYEAEGIKVTKGPTEIALTDQHHTKHEKHDSHYQKKSDPGSMFEPHTLPSEINHRNTAREIAVHLKKIAGQDHKLYKELIIIAEPKMLGYLREYIDNQLKHNIVKEISKDLTKHNAKIIEDLIFD